MVDDPVEISIEPPDSVTPPKKGGGFGSFFGNLEPPKKPPATSKTGHLSAAGANDFAQTVNDILRTIGDSPGGPSQSEIELITSSVREMAHKWTWVQTLSKFRLWLPMLVAGGLWGWRVGKPFLVSKIGAKPEKPTPVPPTQRATPPPVPPEVTIPIDVDPDPYIHGNTTY